MTLRCRELDERLRSSENEKKQYKEQLLRSLQEIAKMKHAREIETDKKLRGEQLKVEQLKMQILTQEERKHLDMERTALGDIRRELADVQRTEMSNVASGYRPPPSMMPGRSTAPVTTATLNVGGGGMAGGSGERQRLVNERAALLATNVYALPRALPLASVCCACCRGPFCLSDSFLCPLCLCVPRLAGTSLQTR